MTDSQYASKKEALLKQLRLSSLPVQREKAALLLSNFTETEVLDALLNTQLYDPSPKVRDAASQSLATLLSYFDSENEEGTTSDNKDYTLKTYNKKNPNYNPSKQVFNLSKKIEILRSNSTNFRFNKKDSIELTQLFNKLNSDRYLKKQINVKSLINSILLLPIEDSNMGRDVAIAITEILRRSFDEAERMTAIGCLNNIITNISSYTPMFGIAEAYLMIFKSTDDSTMRMLAFKCIEEIIIRKQNMSKLSQYTNDIVKLISFSYDRRIREVALKAYPELTLSVNSDSRYLVEQMIRTVRATYEDQLRELGLKALRALLVKDRLTEENFESVIKILKSHHTKNIRVRGIELFITIALNADEKHVDDALGALFHVLMETKDDDICYAAMQNIAQYTLTTIPKANISNIYRLVETIAMRASHPLLAFRTYNLIEKIILKKPKLITNNYITEITDCLHIHSDLGVTEQVIVAFCDLTYSTKIPPEEVRFYIKNILYLSDDSDVLEGLIAIFQELVKDKRKLRPNIILNKLIDVISTSAGKHEIFRTLADLTPEKIEKQ